MNTKKKPLFRRTQGAMYKKLKGKGWRRPDGKHNKIKDGKKGKGETPSIGYGAKKSERYLHPSMKRDILVSNLGDIERIDPKLEAARIASSVGKKKRAVFLEELKKKKIRVLNS